MLTPSEAKLAAAVLEMASDDFSNHGCNDFDLAEYMPDPAERDAFVREAEAWNGTPEEYRSQDGVKDYRMMDWMVMSFLAHKLSN